MITVITSRPPTLSAKRVFDPSPKEKKLYRKIQRTLRHYIFPYELEEVQPNMKEYTPYVLELQS